MSALENALENENQFVEFDREMKDRYLKRSFISMSSGSSFNPDEYQNRKSSSSSLDAFEESMHKSKFFVNNGSREIEESASNNVDFLMNQSPKSSEYLPPNIYRPAYLYKKYKYAELFRLEILNVFLYTFLLTNAQLLCILLSIPNYVSYFFRIWMHSVSLFLTLMLTSTEESSRSINIIPEFMMINAILFNYSLLDIIVYFTIQICISFFTNLLVFVIFYEYIIIIPTEELIHTILYYPSYSMYVKSIPIYSSIIIYSIMLFIMSSIFTQMIDRLTSIEYKKIIRYKVILFMIFNIIFTINVGYVSSMGYNLSSAFSIVCIKNDMMPIYHNTYMIISLTIISIILAYLSTWIGFFHIRAFYNKYIEI
jgi:hypothetical protein